MEQAGEKGEEEVLLTRGNPNTCQCISDVTIVLPIVHIGNSYAVTLIQVVEIRWRQFIQSPFLSFL
jgi:hypothetical protein